jgi:hypothetical protein
MRNACNSNDYAGLELSRKTSVGVSVMEVVKEVLLGLDVIGSLVVQGRCVVCIGRHSHESTYQRREDQHNPRVVRNVIVLQQLIGTHVVPSVCVK